MLRAIVLGAGAGGGFPQWNSAGAGCLRARAADPMARPRTQAAMALSADGVRWLVVNASPDLREQIAATPALHPRPAPLRNSPIAALLLTGAEVDAIMGLLHLRERHAFALHAAQPTLDVLDANPIFRALAPEFVSRHALPMNQPFPLLGMNITAYAVPGKVPLFNEGTAAPGIAEDGQALGLAISAGGATLHYIPGCAMLTDTLRARLQDAECVLFDGTLYTDDEMIRLGAGPKTAARMGHMAMLDTIAAFAPLGVRRRIFTHVNNTNPALLEDSAESAHLAAEGWEVAWDGMEITL